jgi:hypothetical protein
MGVKNPRSGTSRPYLYAIFVEVLEPSNLLNDDQEEFVQLALDVQF